MKEPCETNNGHLPKDWEEVSIGDITTLVYRYPTYYGITYVEQGVPEVRGELLFDNGEIESDPSKFRFVTEDTANKFPKVRLELGDIVMSVRGTMGKIGIVREPLKGAVITANLIRLSPNQVVILPDFFRLALLTPEFNHALNSASPQTTIKTITAPALKDLTLAVPHSIGEQRKIAAVLGLVQRAIEQQERLIALTTELKKALLHKVFTEGLRGEPQKQTKIGPVPESWEVVTLASLFEIKHGYAFEGEFFVAQGRYVLLTPGHFFEEGGFRDQKDKTKYYVGEIPSSYLLAKGDLLVAMTEQKAGLLGSAIIVPESEKFLHNQRLGLIQNLDEQRLDKLFLFYFFNTATVRKQIFLTSSGSKVRHTSPGKIRELSIALPSLDEQGDIVQLLRAVDAKLEVTARKRQTMTDLFHTLLHQLMTAQIRVNDLDFPYFLSPQNNQRWRRNHNSQRM